MTTPTPASDETDRLVKILMDEESASISTHPEYAELMHDIRKHMRALQAENEGLNKLVAAQHGAMRTDWKDLIAERDKYKGANGEVIRRNTELVLDNERLTRELHEVRWSQDVLTGQRNRAAAERDKYRAEIDRLEKAIRDAPHDQDCRWHDEDENGYPLREKDCTCWKREALEHFTGE